MISILFGPEKRRRQETAMAGYHVFAYINMALAGLHAVLAGAHYMRMRKQSYILFAAGAALYSISWLLRASPAGIAAAAPLAMPLESLAVTAWFAGFVWGDYTGRRTAQWLFGVIVAICALASGASAAGLIPTPGAAFLDPMEFVLPLFFAGYAIYMKFPDRHYFVQAMSFLVVAAALSIASVWAGAGAVAVYLGVFTSTAYAAAFISMILLTDALTVSELGRGMRDKEINSIVFEVTDYIAAGMKRIREHAGRECTRYEKLDLTIKAIKNILGYDKVFPGRWEDAGHRLRFDYDPDSDAPRMVSASVVIPELLVSELKAQGAPLLIEDSAGDSRIGDPTLARFDLESFVLLPLTDGGAVTNVLLIGGRPGGGAMSGTDSDILWRVAAHIDSVLSRGGAGKDTSPEPDVDTVTFLRNFSSFQKLLSREIQRADKNGTAFAVFLFDTDRFSSVNEKLGYERGDVILKDIGERLAEHADREYVGRVGADEFAVLIPDAGGDVRARVEHILTDINENLSQICREVPMSMSAAYSLYPYDFFEQTGIFGKMREMLSGGASSPGHIVRVKLG